MSASATSASRSPAVCPAAGMHLDPRREERAVGDEVRDRTGTQLGELVELCVERGHERLVRVERHRAVEQLTGLRRSVHARVGEAAGAADVIDVRVREQDAPHRPAERVHRVDEGLPLRPHHQRVDHGDAVVVDDRARVAHAGLPAGLQPDEHAVGELVQREDGDRRHRSTLPSAGRVEQGGPRCRANHRTSGSPWKRIDQSTWRRTMCAA